MRALFINARERKISEFEFDGKPSAVADILHTNREGVAGVGISDGDTPDVLMCAETPPEDAPYFMVAGVPVPIKGNAVILGVVRTTTVGAKDGGHARDVTATKEWLESNLIWLKMIQSDSGVVAFETASPMPDDVAANMLKSLTDMASQSGGSMKVTTVDKETGIETDMSERPSSSRLH